MQVQYYLQPKGEKPFDVNLLMTRLGQLPGAFRLPDPKEVTFVVAASPAMAKFLAAKVKMDPRTPLHTQGIVTLYPRSIGIMQDAPTQILTQLEGFVTWVMKTYPVNVMSDEGDDWTERYANNPGALFKEEDTWA